jgi:hypothetical protein
MGETEQRLKQEVNALQRSRICSARIPRASPPPRHHMYALLNSSVYSPAVMPITRRKVLPIKSTDRKPHTSATLPLLEEDLGHHSFVLVLEKMAVEEGHPTNDRIGEVHDQIG